MAMTSVIEEAIHEATKLPYKTEVLAACMYPHNGDSHLLAVICKVEKQERHEYVVWTFNRYDRGFHNGRYSVSYADAVTKFHDRIGQMATD